MSIITFMLFPVDWCLMTHLESYQNVSILSQEKNSVTHINPVSTWHLTHQNLWVEISNQFLRSCAIIICEFGETFVLTRTPGQPYCIFVSTITVTLMACTETSLLCKSTLKVCLYFDDSFNMLYWFLSL